jgi:S-adenosylmethionine:tRNA ribosyltransferase-isomerase
MNLADFDYYLPKELIAQYPLRERDSARLLVLERKTASITHRLFKDITDYLSQDDLLVLNDTKVLPCRLIGKRATGGRVEFLLLRRKSDLVFQALVRPGRLKCGEKIIFNGGKISAEVKAKDEVSFLAPSEKAVYNLGAMPLPPYIKRQALPSDNFDYQTVYAKKEGAVASPTAGLHFTRQLLQRIKSLGVGICYLTLHVGLGTFRPVKSEDIAEHKMEQEEVIIPRKTLEILRTAKKKPRRIFAVGTTAVRALETAADFIANYQLPITNYRGKTSLFIYPGYQFRIVDRLLTNFHLPRTTLFMLVSAFAGRGLIKEAYQEAIVRKYRFYSYGDAMLII